MTPMSPGGQQPGMGMAPMGPKTPPLTKKQKKQMQKGIPIQPAAPTQITKPYDIGQAGLIPYARSVPQQQVDPFSEIAFGQ